MEQEKLNEIVKRHEMWLNGEDGGKRADLHMADLQEANLQGANLRGANVWEANLRGADLRRANLRWANLVEADFQKAFLGSAYLCDSNLIGADLWGADLRLARLRGADLRGANIDYSCWSLWCGSFDVTVDRRIAAQIAYHFCRLDCDDPEFVAARAAILKFANTFHRVDECGRLE